MSQATDTAVHATRHGESFEFEAVSEFQADLEQAWEVLTDYDRFSDFIPGMETSHVVVRHAHNVVVDQRGEASLLFFTFPLRVRLVIEESPYHRIVAHAVEGNFREFRGAYDLEVRGRLVRLRYSGQCTPTFSIPPFISTILVRHIVEKRFSAMVDEILRRQRLSHAPTTPGRGSRAYVRIANGKGRAFAGPQMLVIHFSPQPPTLRSSGAGSMHHL